jgi:NADH-quinone oxidoreductase subunit E
MSVTLESVACVGCCGLAPVVLVDDELHGGLDAMSTRKLARSIKRGRG